jgi:hypothetical protein
VLHLGDLGQGEIDLSLDRPKNDAAIGLDALGATVTALGLSALAADTRTARRCPPRRAPPTAVISLQRRSSDKDSSSSAGPLSSRQCELYSLPHGNPLRFNQIGFCSKMSRDNDLSSALSSAATVRAACQVHCSCTLPQTRARLMVRWK